MPIITPDLSQVGPIPPGTYEARILACDARISSKGNPMIVPTIEVDIGGVMRTKDAFLVTSGRGASQFLQLLRACNQDEAAAAMSVPNSKYPFDTDDLVGQEFIVTIEADVFDNAPSEKFAGFMKR